MRFRRFVLLVLTRVLIRVLLRVLLRVVLRVSFAILFASSFASSFASFSLIATSSWLTAQPLVKPLPSLGAPQYDELYWGYFRAQRFAGDFADYGTEIQISDFADSSSSWHVANQARFMREVDFGRPFDVEEMRPLLTRDAPQ